MAEWKEIFTQVIAKTCEDREKYDMALERMVYMEFLNTCEYITHLISNNDETLSIYTEKYGEDGLMIIFHLILHNPSKEYKEELIKMSENDRFHPELIGDEVIVRWKNNIYTSPIPKDQQFNLKFTKRTIISKKSKLEL